MLGRGLHHRLNGLLESFGQLINAGNIVGRREDFRALDNMNAVLAGNQTAYLAHFQTVQGILVLRDEVVQLLPTNIASVGCRGGIDGILLGGIFEGNFAVVDLVKHLLRGFLVVRREQNVRRPLCAGIVRRVHLRILVQRIGIRIVTLEACHQSLGKQGGLDGFAILVLGEARLLQGALPSIVGIVVGLHAVHVIIDFGIVHRDAALFSGRFDEDFLLERLNHLLAHLFRRQRVVHQPLPPGIGAVQTRLGTDALNHAGDIVLGNFLPVDRSRHAASGAIRARPPARNQTASACNGHAHRCQRS